MKISAIKNHNEVEEMKHVELSTVLDSIKSGQKQKELIEHLRRRVSEGASDKEQKEIKKQLGAIMFNGTFKQRNKMGLIDASGLMVLDFDKVGTDFKTEILKNKYVYAGFTSPTGTGYKVLIKIPIVKSDAEFKEYFYAVQEEFPSIDTSGKDISRLCYFTIDEDLFLNESSEVWTKKIPQTPSSSKVGHRVIESDFRPINIAFQMISNSNVGNRHATALKAGRLMGGYIAGGSVDEYEVLGLFQNHIQLHSPDDYKDHIKAFIDGIANGKKEPFTSDEVEEIVVEDKLGKIHVLFDETQAELDELYEKGYANGYKLGWRELDKHYTMLLGSTTYLYSAPYSGKTQLWFNCLVNLSMFYGMKHAVFSPETGSATEVYKELIQTYAKKDYVGNFKMNKEDKEMAEAFVKNYFIVIDPDRYEKDITVADACDYVTMLERKYNERIHTLTLDPWNELKHDYDVRQDLKIDEELKYIRRSAKLNNRHICVVTHVRDQTPIKATNDAGIGYSYFALPTPREVAGGQTWYRKGMMMLAIWRPIMMNVSNPNGTFTIDGRVLSHNETVIQVQKAKPKGTGMVGEISLFYNYKEHVFVDKMGNYADAFSKEKLKTDLIDEEETPW